MKICYLARANYPLLVRRAEMMASLGHEVHIVSLQSPLVEITNCTVHVIETNKILAKLKLHFFTSRKRVTNLLDKIQPDVVDLHGATSYGFYVKSAKKSPTVMTIYGTELYSQANWIYPLKLIARKAVSDSTLVYGSSAVIDKYIQDILGLDLEHKTKHHSWGISLERINKNSAERRKQVRLQHGVESNTKVIFHNRLIAPIWRIELIIEAIPKVIEHDENVVFWFAFAPPNSASKKLLEKYKERVKELGVGQWVRWLGSHDYDDFISLNHASDIYLNVGSHDLLASSLLEAMATGQVPILSDLDVYHEVIENNKNGFFLEEPTSSALEEKIKLVLDNHDTLQKNISEHNLELIKSSYDEMAATKWLEEQYMLLADEKFN